MLPVNGEAPVAHEWGETFNLLGVALLLLQRINLYVINKQ